MSDSITMVEMQQLPEIRDYPADTPKDIGTERRRPLGVLFALTTTSMLTIPNAQLDVYAHSSDQTAAISESAISELPIDPIYKPILGDGQEQESRAELANRTRLELLAREFVDGQLSTEEQARLAIVSERVRRLIPSVTAEDYEVLEAMLGDVKRIENESIERRQRLRIK